MNKQMDDIRKGLHVPQFYTEGRKLDRLFSSEGREARWTLFFRCVSYGGPAFGLRKDSQSSNFLSSSNKHWLQDEEHGHAPKTAPK